MNQRLERRLSGVVGVFLLVLVGGFVAVFGGGVPSHPVVLGQMVLLVVAGLLDVVAGFGPASVGPVAWYRLTGFANVLLGVSIPLGILEAGGGPGGLLFLILVSIGGLSLVAMGLDVAVFHGRYTRGERLDAE